MSDSTPTPPPSDFLGELLGAARNGGPAPAVPDFVITSDPDAYMANLVRVASGKPPARPRPAHGPWAPPRDEDEADLQERGRGLIAGMMSCLEERSLSRAYVRQRLEGRYLEGVPGMPEVQEPIR